jgi:molybdopterin-guanine dinucleotide biosynthesis protein A
MAIEGVLLTGGSSTRMGADKATLLVDGVPLAERTLRELQPACVKVTVLGAERLAGTEFAADESPGAGPVAALARFEPTEEFVFVVACDLPRFEGRLIDVLRGEIGDADLCAPVRGGTLQPLCALYRASAFDAMTEVRASGSNRVMEWIDRLDARAIDEARLAEAGLDPRCAASANTPEELASLLSLG